MWGELSWGEILVGRVVLGRVVFGASCPAPAEYQAMRASGSFEIKGLKSQYFNMTTIDIPEKNISKLLY